MAKAKVKTINITGSSNSSVSTSITTPTGAGIGPVPAGTQLTTNPPGQTVTGTLQDIATGTIYPFSQAFGAELGITAVGVKVNYQLAGNGTANSVRLLEKGEITSINPTDDGGTLLVYPKSGNAYTLPFAQSFAAETPLNVSSGAAAGTMVHFETIVDPNSGQLTAVALEVI